MLLTDAIDRFLTQLRADGRSAATVATYARHVGALERWFAPRSRVDALTPTAVAQYLASDAATTTVAGCHRSAATVNLIRASLRAFGAYLEASQILATNPARLVRAAKTSAKPPRVLTTEELAKLFAALSRATGRAEERDRAMIQLLAATGIRLKSLLSLDVADVDFGARELVLRTSKSGEPLRVPIPESLLGPLRQFCGRREHGPLFQNTHGRALTARHVQRRLELWAERAGLLAAVSPHALRHTLAQNVYNQTGDILVVAAVLGHKHLSSALRYARADRRRVRAAMESVNLTFPQPAGSAGEADAAGDEPGHLSPHPEASFGPAAPVSHPHRPPE